MLVAEFWSWSPRVLRPGTSRTMLLDALMAAVHVPMYLAPQLAVKVPPHGLFFDAHAAGRPALQRYGVVVVWWWCVVVVVCFHGGVVSWW